MARIRSVKPEMRRSLTVSSWPIPVRWTFVGLPCYLDDAGRGLDDLRLIKSELYPLDDVMTPRRIDQHLGTIAEYGPLCRYEVAGQRYLHVTSWAEHQRINRPSPSRIPPCPIHEKDVSDHGALSESSVSPHGALTTSRAREEGKGREQGKEGKGSGVLGSQSIPDRTEPATGDGLDLDRLANILGTDRAWANRVVRQILERAPAGVRDKQRYVEAAIRERPADYRPTPQPPGVHDLCDHGRAGGSCVECVKEVRA